MRIESKFALLSTLVLPLLVATAAAAGEGGGGAGGCPPSGVGGGVTAATGAGGATTGTTTTSVGAGGGCSTDFTTACVALCRVTCPTSDAHEHFRCMAACNDTCPGESRATCTPPSCDDLCGRHCHDMADDECQAFTGERFFACVATLDRRCLSVCEGNCGSPCRACKESCVDGCATRCRDTPLATSPKGCMTSCTASCDASCCGGPNGGQIAIGVDTPVGATVPPGERPATLDTSSSPNVAEGSTCSISPGASSGAALLGGLAACFAALATRRRRRPRAS